jgi:hypothetical protein
VGAAIFCVPGWNAGTSQISAFPGVRHNPPSSIRWCDARWQHSTIKSHTDTKGK